MGKFIRLGSMIINAAAVRTLTRVAYGKTYEVKVRYIDDVKEDTIFYKTVDDLDKEYEAAWQRISDVSPIPPSNVKKFVVG